MKSSKFNRKSRINGVPLPRTVTTKNDPELNAVLKKMSNAEYKHFVSFSLLSHVPASQLDPNLSSRYSEFRSNMIKKYSVWKNKLLL